MNESQCASALARKIRLKNLLDEGQEIENNMNKTSASDTLQAIRRIIVASDEIIGEGEVEERAEHTTEVVMDAQVLKMNHELVSRVMKQTSSFDPTVYHNAICKLVLKDDEANWERLTEMVFEIWHTVRAKPSMLGAVDPEIIERSQKERKKTSKKPLAAESRPENIAKLERQDKGAKKVNIVHKQLVEISKANDMQPIPYYKLIIDPSNFMNTVENAFQIAFLARDNLIVIQNGDDNYPEVRLMSSSERKQEKDTLQDITTLNTSICQKMIEYYGIESAMLNIDEEDD